MKGLIVVTVAGLLLAGKSWAAAIPPAGATAIPAGVSLSETVKGGHGGFRPGNRGLHRGWTRGRGNPHRFRRR